MFSVEPGRCVHVQSCTRNRYVLGAVLVVTRECLSITVLFSNSAIDSKQSNYIHPNMLT